MSNGVIIPANAQLSEKDRTCVFISTETGRILGFGHESMQMLYTEGWRREILFHAWDIERMAEKFRKQEQEDREADDFKRTEREAPVRNALKAALRARRAAVGPADRRYIDANLKLMDAREERAKKRKVDSYLISEMYDSSKTDHEIGLDSNAFKTKV
jgi:hypothetical protein